MGSVSYLDFQTYITNILVRIEENHILSLCRNLERNQLIGSIPAKLMERSKNGSLSLRYGSIKDELFIIVILLNSHFQKIINYLIC